jgi:hypothetical protein
MYDAFGNFEYGATGSAAGYSSGTLTGMGDVLHGGANDPINTQDILSGANAINNSGTLSTIDSSQIGSINQSANGSGDNTPTVDPNQTNTMEKK